MQQSKEFDNLYRPFLESLYKEDEIQSNEMDLQLMMGQLNKQVLDYDKIFKFMQKQRDGELSEIEKAEMQQEEEIVKEKIKQAEATKTYIKFFNPYTEKLIKSTPPDVLSELGIRAYTGSRDVPKDDEKASGLL